MPSQHGTTFTTVHERHGCVCGGWILLAHLYGWLTLFLRNIKAWASVRCGLQAALNWVYLADSQFIQLGQKLLCAAGHLENFHLVFIHTRANKRCGPLPLRLLFSTSWRCQVMTHESSATYVTTNNTVWRRHSFLTLTMSCIRECRKFHSSCKSSSSRMSWSDPLGQYSVSRYGISGSTQAPTKRTRCSWCRSFSGFPGCQCPIQSRQ